MTTRFTNVELDAWLAQYKLEIEAANMYKGAADAYINQHYYIHLEEKKVATVLNTSNVPCSITIWYATARRAMTQTDNTGALIFQGDFTNTGSANVAGTTIEAAEIAGALQGTEALGQIVAAPLGVTPYQNAWTKLFQLKKGKSFKLGPGRMFKAVIMRKMARMSMAFWYNTDTSTALPIPKGAQTMFFQCTPQVAHDVANQALINNSLMSLTMTVASEWCFQPEFIRPNTSSLKVLSNTYATQPGAIATAATVGPGTLVTTGLQALY